MSPLGRFLYAFAKNSVIVLAKVLFFIRYKGAGNIPRTGGVILASNHASHLDPPLVGVGVPRKVTFIAKQELFRVPLLGWWLRQIGQISVERGGGGRAALNAAEKVLRDGGVIIIFPEGTRTQTGRMGRGHTGVAVLALKTGVPVVPVAIEGTFEAFGKGKRIIKPNRVSVVYGEPIHFDQLKSQSGEIQKQELETATAKVMLAIQEQLPEKRRPREGEAPKSQILAGDKVAPTIGG